MNDITQQRRDELAREHADDEAAIKQFSDMLKAQQGPQIPDEVRKVQAPWLFPPEDWRDREEYEFAGFIMHFHEENCIACGGVTHWSETFRAYWRKTDHRTTRMRPMGYRLPEGAGITVFRVPVKQIPICAHCVSSSREGTAVYLVSDEKAWNEARRREDEARLNQRRHATATRNKEYAPVDLSSVPDDI